MMNITGHGRFADVLYRENMLLKPFNVLIID